MGSSLPAQAEDPPSEEKDAKLGHLKTTVGTMRGAIVFAWCWALLALGCASLESRVRRASLTDCATLTREYAEIKGDSGYAELGRSERQPYETEVANCWLVAKKPREALNLARSWRTDEPDRYMISARAAAVLGDAPAVEAELEKLAELGGPDDFEFYSADEFAAFTKRDWFVRVAAQGYNPDEGIPFERHVERVLSRAGQRLLPLRLAVADPSRAAGEWVLWLGIVHQGRLDRERARTLLFVEGAEIDRHLESIDRRVERVETTGESRPGWFGTRQLSATSKPVYSPTERTYAESFVPNGQRFLVEFSGISEELATLPGLYVLGRFKGRDPETQQLLVDAVLIQPRTPKKTTETTP